LREFDEQHPGRTLAVRFITIGSQAKAEAFCAPQIASQLCIGDEDKRTYRAMGLESYNFLRLFSDRALQRRHAENKAAGFSQNWSATKLADGAQLPGAAIVDARGVIRWLHRGAHPGDLPPMSAMLERAQALAATPAP
jgi:hypothetical protein